jgi:hypothetical protein
MNNKIEMKMKKNQLTMLVLFVTMLGFTACSDDDKVSISTVGITTTVDTTIEGLQLTGGTYTFENVNTSVKTDITYPAQSIELAVSLIADVGPHFPFHVTCWFQLIVCIIPFICHHIDTAIIRIGMVIVQLNQIYILKIRI